MTTQTLIIPVKPISWNVLLRKHYWTVKKVFDEWNEATRWTIKDQGIKPVKTYPVSIHVHAAWKYKHVHDIDGIVFKPVIDTLVKQGILQADDLNYLGQVVCTGEVGAKMDALIITLIENYGTQQSS